MSVHGSAGTGGVADLDANYAQGGAGGGQGFSLPVAKGSYRLTARFNQAGKSWSSGFHTGLDFAASVGTPIYSVGPGKVVATSSTGPYGNLTKVQVGNAVIYYAHQSIILVSAGQEDAAGQVIGKVGNTGNSFGPHVHVEVRINGAGVDPDAWLTARGAQP